MILAVDTSTKTLNIAVADRDKILGETCLDTGLRHSETLVEQLDLLLKRTRTGLKDLGKIVCSVGPGSFTGIRVGLSACRTMAQVLRLPLVGVSTLDILACGAQIPKPRGTKLFVCPVIANQQEEVYTGLYELKDNGSLKKTGPFVSINIDKLLDKMAKKCRSPRCRAVFVGDAAALYGERIKSRLDGRAVLLGQEFSNPRASVMIKMSRGARGTHYEKVRPLYIKPPRIYG